MSRFKSLMLEPYRVEKIIISLQYNEFGRNEIVNEVFDFTFGCDSPAMILLSGA